jgi:3-carboxy-cis,cis-muconate cycloisomerase
VRFDKGIGIDWPEWLGRAQMSTSLSPLLAPMLSSAAMRAVCDDAAALQNMLDFEAALARAEAALGVIPASAAGPITNACKAESFDLAALAEAATRSGNLAIPLVKALTANVAKADAEAARYVHWGATSQDVIDSGAMLGLRAGIDALLGDIDRAIAGFAALARQHRHTPVVARTWLQHALPMPFGLKLAEYAAALHRSKLRLQRVRSETLALQFGGAAGTLAALGDNGLKVAEKLAEALKLPLPDAPWHTHRDRIAEAASVFAIIAGTCGKIARDVSLMMQTDIGEAFEPSGEGRGQRAGGSHHGSQSRGDDPCRAGAGPRAQRRPLARGMADLADAAAGHLGRACGDRRYRRGAGS